MNIRLSWHRVLLIGLNLAVVALVAWFCVPDADSGIERRFVATLWAASALVNPVAGAGGVGITVPA